MSTTELNSDHVIRYINDLFIQKRTQRILNTIYGVNIPKASRDILTKIKNKELTRIEAFDFNLNEVINYLESNSIAKVVRNPYDSNYSMTKSFSGHGRSKIPNKQHFEFTLNKGDQIYNLYLDEKNEDSYKQGLHSIENILISLVTWETYIIHSIGRWDISHYRDKIELPSGMRISSSKNKPGMIIQYKNRSFFLDSYNDLEFSLYCYEIFDTRRSFVATVKTKMIHIPNNRTPIDTANSNFVTMISECLPRVIDNICKSAI